MRSGLRDSGCDPAPDPHSQPNPLTHSPASPTTPPQHPLQSRTRRISNLQRKPSQVSTPTAPAILLGIHRSGEWQMLRGRCRRGWRVCGTRMFEADLRASGAGQRAGGGGIPGEVGRKVAGWGLGRGSRTRVFHHSCSHITDGCVARHRRCCECGVAGRGVPGSRTPITMHALAFVVACARATLRER